MNGKITAMLLSGVLFACAPMQPPAATMPPPPAAAAVAPPPPAAVPADRYVVIRRATCDTYLALAPDDRAEASMFYIGYQASRFGSGSINVGAIPTIEQLAINYCSAYPGRTVATAFANAYLRGR